jgi:hypothetical protein
MKRSVWLGIGLVVLVILGAGAFTAVQLLTAQNDPDVPPERKCTRMCSTTAAAAR